MVHFYQESRMAACYVAEEISDAVTGAWTSAGDH
jgi:hypothetical protein